MGLFRTYKIEDLKLQLSREDLLHKSRILIVDDERPDLIEDLQRARFSVDYYQDITKDNLDIIDRPTYDLVILDFGSVGTKLGSDQGLTLLRHIKRVNPSVVVFAYTSKSLGVDHADFYRMADGVLRKDAGIQESTEKIEEGLRQALSITNLWMGMINVLGIRPGSKEDLRWQDLYIRALPKPQKQDSFKLRILSVIGGEGGRVVGTVIIEKLLELGARAVIGG